MATKPPTSLSSFLVKSEIMFLSESSKPKFQASLGNGAISFSIPGLEGFTHTIRQQGHGTLFAKKKNGGKGHAVTFAVSGFHFFQGTYSQVMKQSSFSTNFCIVELLSLNYVIRFYKPKKGLFLSRF